MARQDVGTRDVRSVQQGVQVSRDPRAVLPGRDGITGTSSWPVVDTDSRVARHRGRDQSMSEDIAPPPGLEHNGWAARTGAVQVEAMVPR